MGVHDTRGHSLRRWQRATPGIPSAAHERQAPEIRFHDPRHTFASLLIQNGEPLTYVKEQMGHSSIQVTVDVYGHLGRARIARPWTSWTRYQPATQTQPTRRTQMRMLAGSD
ncbi:MAG: hypothetical protein DMF84_19805 [Acidobacteria bacterium]|nr:MAG: hypothetical protein DMF84_19805 [Acidobacteriota bacterium]